ncbi:hypothetical protein V2J09_011516 [Rumex salicifolius]
MGTVDLSSHAPPSLHLLSPSSVAGACVLLLLPAGASSSSFVQCWCVLLLLSAVSVWAFGHLEKRFKDKSHCNNLKGSFSLYYL